MLGDLGPHYFAFLISFGVVALYWRAHHRMFRYIVRWDAGLLGVNMIFLFVVVQQPLLASILGVVRRPELCYRDLRARPCCAGFRVAGNVAVRPTAQPGHARSAGALREVHLGSVGRRRRSISGVGRPGAFLAIPGPGLVGLHYALVVPAAATDASRLVTEYEALTAVSWGAHRIDLFWVAPDRSLMHRWWDGGAWSTTNRSEGSSPRLRRSRAGPTTRWKSSRSLPTDSFGTATGTARTGTHGNRSAESSAANPPRRAGA